MCKYSSFGLEMKPVDTWSVSKIVAYFFMQFSITQQVDWHCVQPPDPKHDFNRNVESLYMWSGPGAILIAMDADPSKGSMRDPPKRHPDLIGLFNPTATCGVA